MMTKYSMARLRHATKIDLKTRIVNPKVPQALRENLAMRTNGRGSGLRTGEEDHLIWHPGPVG
jgi:hypothetical protein